MKTIKDLELALSEYRAGYRAIPTYDELTQLVAGAAASYQEGHSDGCNATIRLYATPMADAEKRIADLVAERDALLCAEPIVPPEHASLFFQEVRRGAQVIHAAPTTGGELSALMSKVEEGVRQAIGLPATEPTHISATPPSVATDMACSKRCGNPLCEFPHCSLGPQS